MITSFYQCRRCGNAQLATVTAHRAQPIAMLLALAPCPACGGRDAALAARNARTRVMIVGALVIVFAAMIAALGLAAWKNPSRQPMLRWLEVGMMPPLAIIGVLACKLQWLRRPTDVEVQFSATPR